MHKKPLFLVIFLLFLFTICSGCVKNLENCKIFPKIEVKTSEKNESSDKSSDKKMNTEEKIVDSTKNGTTTATASCNF